MYFGFDQMIARGEAAESFLGHNVPICPEYVMSSDPNIQYGIEASKWNLFKMRQNAIISDF